MSEKRGPTTVTPIKKSMKHQKEEGAKKVDVNNRRTKSYDTNFNGREVKVVIDEDSEEVIIDNKLYKVDILEEEGHFTAIVEDTHKYKIEYHGGQIFLEGRLIDFSFAPSVPKLERKSVVKEGEMLVKAPLPGKIIEINVQIGENVKIGQKLVTLEAMKMQNDILCEQEGTIKDIFVEKSDLVASDQKILLITSKS